MKLYRGVVEDNNHPNKNGYVRVRIFGIHTENNEHSGAVFEFIKTSDLPWAEVIHGTDFGLVGGIGLSSILRKGTWVWVILENDDPNVPKVLGTISGKQSLSPTSKYTSGNGFFDPSGKIPFTSRSSEEDLNRLTRGENLSDQYYDAITNAYNSTNTIHKQINDHLDTVSKTDTVSGADVSQTEPSSTNNLTQYPECAVLETSSGHVIEIDDTGGNERVRVYHKSGSYIEVKPDGSFVQKSTSTGINHYIHMGDLNEHIAKSVKSYIEKNIEQIILGGIKQSVEMDFFKHIGGYFKITADGNLEIDADLKVTGNVEVTEKVTATGDITSKSQVADSQGNLSSLRDAHDTHDHIGNLGVPTSKPTPTDPKTRTSDFAWSSTPKGFK